MPPASPAELGHSCLWKIPILWGQPKHPSAPGILAGRGIIPLHAGKCPWLSPSFRGSLQTGDAAPGLFLQKFGAEVAVHVQHKMQPQILLPMGMIRVFSASLDSRGWLMAGGAGAKHARAADELSSSNSGQEAQWG